MESTMRFSEIRPSESESAELERAKCNRLPDPMTDLPDGHDDPSSDWFVPESVRPYYTDDLTPEASRKRFDHFPAHVGRLKMIEAALQGKVAQDPHGGWDYYFRGRGGWDFRDYPPLYSEIGAKAWSAAEHRVRLDQAEQAHREATIQEAWRRQHTCEVCGILREGEGVTRHHLSGVSAAPNLDTDERKATVVTGRKRREVKTGTFIACDECAALTNFVHAQRLGALPGVNGTRLETVNALLGELEPQSGRRNRKG